MAIESCTNLIKLNCQSFYEGEFNRFLTIIEKAEINLN
jgi:hypothetical protein